MKRLIVLFVVILVLTGCENPAGEGGANRTGSVAATGISGALPAKILVGYAVDLNGYITVEPENATHKAIAWTIEINGVTADNAANGIFTPTETGTLNITATIPGGKADGGDFVKDDYTVTVIGEEDYVAAVGITGVPESGFAGIPIDLNGATVEPDDATYNRIVWSVESGGAVAGGKLTAFAAGTLTVRGTVTSPIENYTDTFTIQIVAQPGTWTKAAGVPVEMPNEIQTVCYGNGVFVAGSRENDGRIAWSDDGGVTWHGLDSETTTFQDTINDKVVENFVHVRFLNDKFWAVGGNHHMATSENGKTWTAVANPGITGNIVDIAYGEVDGSGVFVAGGDKGTMSYSTNGGATWTANNQTTTFTAGGSVADFKAIIFAEGKFLAVGQFAKAIYSSDGKTWTNVSDTVKTKIIQHFQSSWPSRSGHLGLSVAAYGAGVYLIGGQGVLGISSDLENWERIDMEPFGFARGHSFGWINSLIYADGLFVLGGGDGKAAYSANGRDWIPADTNPIFHNFHFINGLAYDGDGGFVAVGATCTSPDLHNSVSTNSYVHLGNVGCVAYIKP
jgi:hypothetical protein